MNRPMKPPSELPGPNEKCWCGSGNKYKRCHQEEDEKSSRNKSSQTASKRIRPGVLSPRRTVPLHIPRPDYALTGTPGPRSSDEVKSPDLIARMRRACKAAAQLLIHTSTAIRPGVTTDELDAICHEECIRLGGYPSPLNYRGFPKSLCTSVNEVICHGIPDNRALEDGDIVNLDVTIYLDGVHGDTNATYLVGNADDASKQLVEVTRESLMRGIAAVKPGRPISDIGRAIETYVNPFGLSVVRSFCGHGIGEQFHSSLQIPHYYDKSADTIIRPGMTFTIEPMVNIGTWRDVMWDDGWTAVTADGKRSAQFEHTLLVNDSGAEILTQL